MKDVLAGGNLVYSAPTSAGKSAVAEVLMLRRLILTKRPALLVLPFVSLCAEKVAHLERLLAPINKCGPPCKLPAVSALIRFRFDLGLGCLCAEKVAHLERLLAPLNKCGPPDTLPVVSA